MCTQIAEVSGGVMLPEKENLDLLGLQQLLLHELACLIAGLSLGLTCAGRDTSCMMSSDHCCAQAVQPVSFVATGESDTQLQQLNYSSTCPAEWEQSHDFSSYNVAVCASQQRSTHMQFDACAGQFLDAPCYSRTLQH